MAFRSIFTACIALCCATAGCQKDSQNQQSAMHSVSKTKPLVALFPIIDNTHSEQYRWNLSDEFTSSIYSCLAQGPLYLESMPKVRELVKKCKEAPNPFGANISWIKKIFNKEQFVVFLELVQHEEVLIRKFKEMDPKSCDADLKLCMRVRVFDLRAEEPRIILQELIDDSHFIPRNFTRINFQHVPWGDDNFNFSPLGLAHWEFVKEISTRIEDYIIFAQKLI